MPLLLLLLLHWLLLSLLSFSIFSYLPLSVSLPVLTFCCSSSFFLLFFLCFYANFPFLFVAEKECRQLVWAAWKNNKNKAKLKPTRLHLASLSLSSLSLSPVSLTTLLSLLSPFFLSTVSSSLLCPLFFPLETCRVLQAWILFLSIFYLLFVVALATFSSSRLGSTLGPNWDTLTHKEKSEKTELSVTATELQLFDKWTDSVDLLQVKLLLTEKSW